jgi:hypothetical protein
MLFDKRASFFLNTSLFQGENRSLFEENLVRRMRIIAAPPAPAVKTPLSNPAEIGRVRNTVGSPRAMSIAHRGFASISGPSTKASTSGAGSKSCLTNQ